MIAASQLGQYNVPQFMPNFTAKLDFAPEPPVSTAEMYAKIYGISVPRSLRGLGTDFSSPQTINQLVTTGASTTVGILTALSVVGGPVGAAIGGLIAVGSMIANMFHGCGQTCIAASNDANKVEDILKQNLQNYQQSPVHYASLQAAALNNAATAMQALYQACSDPQLGAAGQRCISERLVAGGTAPWCPNPGHTGCDWFALYVNPIKNDPTVVADPNPLTQAVDSLTGQSGTSPPMAGMSSLLPILLLVGGAFILMEMF